MNTQFFEWFEHFRETVVYQELSANPAAYFCAEYAFLPTLPTYAGGLGVLAGDFIFEAAMQSFPLFSVGLYYKDAQNDLVPRGREELTAEQVGLSVATDKNGARVLISIPIHDRTVHVQAWRWIKGNARLFLLDTDVPENHPQDRDITKSLYVENREMRLKQELVLGIGGFRMLSALGHHISVYHLNEGHSAFLALELIHHEMKHQRVDFHTAQEYAKKHIFFTNHTLVAAGQEQFTTELVSAMITEYAEEMGVTTNDIISLGIIEGSNLFSMTIFSFRLSTKANAVSEIHAKTARKVWPEYTMETITNGIHIPRWDKIQSTSELWERHQGNKEILLKYIKKRTGADWKIDELTLGWARRLVPYKRPLALTDDIEQLLRIAGNTERPIRIIYAGPTNNAYEDNNEFVAQLKQRFGDKLKDVGVFLSNYNTEISELMTSGCDLWLNTPIVGSEACGTSGMKALLNGGLTLSTRDGWVAEAPLGDIGWMIEEGDVTTHLLELLEHEIAPLYYKHIKSPEQSQWNKRIQMGRELILKQFSMARALKDYIEKFYVPTLLQQHLRNYK